ncbi:hypothetical protein NPIL_458881 [Nephila pilipes]|uniref:Uncharacterized protein n=1 Tax=Nephila pilipes TaxID=299642 RepID=A0A8X6NV46_NEPPI|nr:hypothetical protein NPIL_458881 [Nephila pilipes]
MNKQLTIHVEKVPRLYLLTFNIIISSPDQTSNSYFRTEIHPIQGIYSYETQQNNSAEKRAKTRPSKGGMDLVIKALEASVPEK